VSDAVEEDVRTPPADDDLRALVARLARPHRSGGAVVERAAILAAGADFNAVMAWIEQHGGEPEAPPVRRAARGGGLHGSRASAAAEVPLRFILPAGALG
jgi:hypothetical protein